MSTPAEQQDLTALLAAAAEGDQQARDKFVDATYNHLRGLAAKILSSEAPAPTLQPTILVNEALLRLFGGRPPKAENRKHFLNIAAQQMRRVLIDRARSHASVKRKGLNISLDDASQIPLQRSAELIALDDALNEFAELDPEAADVVEKKFFGGFTDEETATVLNMSEAKVRRHWTYARAWLHDHLANT